MISGAQVSHAWRWGVVASNPLVPDARGGHHDPREAGPSCPHAPVSLLAVDEECGVEHPDAIHDAHAHQDRATGHPVHLVGFAILSGITLVLPEVVGAPL